MRRLVVAIGYAGTGSGICGRLLSGSLCLYCRRCRLLVLLDAHLLQRSGKVRRRRLWLTTEMETVHGYTDVFGADIDMFEV